MRLHDDNFFCRAFLILAAAGMLWASGAAAGIVTFSGTVSYTGTYSGDSLYVGVLDTTNAGGDVTLLALQVFDPGPPPFDQAFSLDFDNTGVGSQVMVASLLDVDGDGTNSVSGADVFGWYNGGAAPVFISSTTSHTGLDFALPRAEIHGTLTFTTGQTQARVQLSPDGHCIEGSFRPSDPFTGAGPYAIIGVYPGTYCINAEGGGTGGYWTICYGDPTCKSPITVTIGPTDVKTGIDFDFSSVAPVEHTSWGLLKSRY